MVRRRRALCKILLQKLRSIVKVQRFFERRPCFRIVTGDHLNARLPGYLVQLLNGAHLVNGRSQKTRQRFFVPMILATATLPLSLWVLVEVTFFVLMRMLEGIAHFALIRGWYRREEEPKLLPVFRSSVSA